MRECVQKVADIRKLNGLVTDPQMFAHKSLLIPLPQRHLLSQVLLNGEQKAPCQPRNDVADSIQSLKLNLKQCKMSPAMGGLQGYCGHSPRAERRPVSEGIEMSVYGTTGRPPYSDDQSMPRESLFDSLPCGPRKSRSSINEPFLDNRDMPGVKAVTEASGSSEDERPIRSLAPGSKSGTLVDVMKE